MAFTMLQLFLKNKQIIITCKLLPACTDYCNRLLFYFRNQLNLTGVLKHKVKFLWHLFLYDLFKGVFLSFLQDFFLQEECLVN